MVLRTLMTGVLLVQPPLLASQTDLAHPPVVQLPQGPITRIPSPDGKWTLTFECPNNCKERVLSIEDNASHKRRLVRKYERTLGISWAPDSHLFFVNDMYASNGTLVYIHDPVTLKTTDLADMIVAADPHAAGFLKAGHSYLEAKSWLNSRELLVVLYGHFDESPPARGFNLQYRVGIDGSVHRLSQRTREKP